MRRPSPPLIIGLGLLCSALLLACSRPAQLSPDQLETQRFLLTDALVAALNAHDASAAVGFFTDRAVLIEDFGQSPVTLTSSGRDGIAEKILTWNNQHLSLHLENYRLDGNTVVADFEVVTDSFRSMGAAPARGTLLVTTAGVHVTRMRLWYDPEWVERHFHHRTCGCLGLLSLLG